MSKPMKILLALAGVLLLAAVVLTMFGKPPNLPLGPLQGILAGDDAGLVAEGGDPFGGGGAIECPPGADPLDQGAADPAGAGADSGAGGADPGAAGVDPAAPAGADGAPADAGAEAGAPVASGAGDWAAGDRVVAAPSSRSHAGSAPGGGRIVAAEAVDPAAAPDAGPAGGEPAGAGVDPAGAGVDPAGAGAGAADPGAVDGGLDPAATPEVVDPCADPAGADPGAGGAGAGDPGAGGDAGGAGGAAGTGAGGVGAGAAGGPTTSDGANRGNSPEALRIAKDATDVMEQAKIQVSTTATLVPSAGGVAKGAALRRYRGNVTAAVLVMQLDAAAQQQWTGAGKRVQRDLVRSFLARLAKTYPRASRSVTVVDEQGTALAIGDAATAATGSVRLF